MSSEGTTATLVNSDPPPTTLESNTKRTVQQLQGHRGVHVLPPVLPVRGHRDLPVGPFAGEMDAHTSHDGGTVLQAERGQMQTVSREQRGNTQSVRTFGSDTNTSAIT